MYILELAQLSDIVICYEIIKEGRDFQKEQGFEQWTETYPNRDTILKGTSINAFFDRNPVCFNLKISK